MDLTEPWLRSTGFPQGDIYLGKTQAKRMQIVSSLKPLYDFVAGIGDGWDDNELHLELGGQSFRLQAYAPNWYTAKSYLPTP